MPRSKSYKAFLKKLGFDLNDESVKRDLEIFEKAHEEAKKLGLDKMTMDEIDKEIRAARKEAAVVFTVDRMQPTICCILQRQTEYC